MKKLIFAPIIRVSTEIQEERGASLEVQRKQITDYVQKLSGSIPDHCWQYSGQEHATSDFERRKLDQLLRDAGKGLFNAVIVADISRWSRDNEKSKQGLKILRENQIRFFVGSTEYDLFNPEHNFILGMGAEVHELFARQQAFKSVMGKIEKSRNNIPAVGLLPFGRTFDFEKNEWGIDEEKQAMIRQAAERYLAGESLINIAKTLNMGYSNLHKRLKHQCGDKWTVAIKSKHFNINEEITLTIPRLLPEETIRKIHDMMQANRTYRHGRNGERITKNRYLLGRMIFCDHCGQTLSGFASPKGKRYYRHFPDRTQNPTKCPHNKFIHAAELETAVLLHLVSTLGDKAKIQKAIKAANPDLTKLKALHNERKKLNDQLKELEKQKDNIVDMVAKGGLSVDYVKKSMTKLKDKETAINSRLTIVDNEIQNMPDEKRSKRLAEWSKKIIYDSTKNNPKIIFKRPWEWKRDLLESVFAGTDNQGKRLGVYMRYENDQWYYEIRGHCEGIFRQVQIDDEYLADMLNLDPQYCDVASELQHLRAGNREYFSYQPS